MPYFKYQGKSVFYTEYGRGTPVLFLHGNTSSSKMLEPLMPLYTGQFRCILIDFLGNSRSDRVECFSSDIWYEEGLQAIALAEHLPYGKTFLVGTSGGAWAAIHAALERPDLFRAVIADSSLIICRLKGVRQRPIRGQERFMRGVRDRTGKPSLTLTQRPCCSLQRRSAIYSTNPWLK